MTAHYGLSRGGVLYLFGMSVVMGCAGVAISVDAALSGVPGSIPSAAIMALISGAMFGHVVVLCRLLAKRVVLSDSGLDARLVSGRRIALSWDDISTVQAADQLGIRLTYVIARDSRSVGFVGTIKGYDELIATVERSARSLDPVPRRLSLWERMALL